MKDPIDWITLSLLPGLGLKGLWRLLQYFKTPQAILAATIKQLKLVPGITQKQLSGFSNLETVFARAKQENERLRRFGGRAIGYDDNFYPERLRQLCDPPVVLYVVGNPELLSKPSVSVVGSRAATAYGLRVSCNLSEALARVGITVISGLALGIDTQAHLGTLKAGGNTVGVLGCGLDVIYPKSNGKLYKDIGETGLLVSEYPLGTRPDSFRFPARNRIIAGVAEGVVVVEAARKSGSLITAQIALDAGREVFAVPGQIDSFKSEGTHWLLQQGAKLVQNVDDIISELGYSNKPDSQLITSEIENFDLEIDPDALKLLKHIEPYPQQRDELILKSGQTAARVSELLLFLELEGLIELIPGNQVRKL